MGAAASLELQSRIKTLQGSWKDFSDVKRCKILTFVDNALTEAVIKVCPCPLTVTILYALGLNDNADLLTNCDAYVKLELYMEGKETQTFRTKTVNNTRAPVWNETFTFVPGGVVGSKLILNFFDEDYFTDDNIGKVEVTLTPNAFGSGSGDCHMLLEGDQGTIVFRYKLKPHDLGIMEAETFEELMESMESTLDVVSHHNEELAKELERRIQEYLSKIAEEVISERVVVRKEIRTLSEEESTRYINAIKKMMENRDGPETSEFFRLAGYHGWPEDYCTHRQENFPHWHRAYLLHFECALQEADMCLGNDGNIGLPYWDFGRYELNGQVFPRCLRQLEQLPEGFLKPDTKNPLAKKGYQIGDDKAILEKLQKSRMREQLYKCLEENNHWKHASCENTTGISLEEPHNSAHMSIGFPLTSLNYAGFHPIFFLLHCNVDRYYAKYISLESDSIDEFRDHQIMRQEQGEPNMFDELLKPFKSKTSDSFYHVREMMVEDTSKLGYVFDNLPKRRPPQMSEAPIYALFPAVDVVRKLMGEDGETKSFALHIFVINNEHMEDWEYPYTSEKLNESYNVDRKWMYAGSCTAFGGKGPNCRNCQFTHPVNLKVDITHAIKQLSNSRHRVSLRVMCMDEYGEVSTLEELQSKYGKGVEIPNPKIVGSYFESLDAEIHKDSENQIEGEILQLQKYLAKYGYYDGELNGVFDEKLDACVKKFQRFHGFIEDGVVGPITKSIILSSRNDSHNDVEDQDLAVFKKGDTVTWWLGASPGYLNAKLVESETLDAFLQWETALNGSIKFKQVESAEDAMLKLTWSNRSSSNDFAFDGRGGAIAHTTETGIEFDNNERWVIDKNKPRKGDDFLYVPVLLHEIGHCLGLRGHSNNPKDVMAAYYVENRSKLSENDISRVNTLYG